MDNNALFTVRTEVPSLDECHFYHTMEIPGHGIVSGAWDLREGVDAYLGNTSLAGKRVLEIGPASGFLTFEMEKRGAQVVSVEVTDDPGWDFVPYPADRMETVYGQRREVMTRLKNSYWFGHAAYRSKAKMYYGDVYRLPGNLGEFDVAVMGAVLLHCHSPLQIVEQCAQRANSLVITDMLYPDLEGNPVCRLAPSPENFSWHTWWHFSTAFFTQFLRVIGFDAVNTSTHKQYHRGKAYTLFTVVGGREGVG